MGKATLNGVTLHYQTMGQGDDIVLIHGLGSSLGFWSPGILIPLARAFRVTLFDLRGHGRSGMPDSGYTTADMAQDLASLVGYLGINRAHLVGHSFGGAVALHCAVLFPNIVRCLVLADARIRAFQPKLTGEDLLQNEQFIAKLASMGIVIPHDEQEAGIWLLEKFADPNWRRNHDNVIGGESFIPFVGGNKNNGNQAAKRWLQLLNTTSARKDFGDNAGLTEKKIRNVQHPTLTMYGENLNAGESLQALQRILPRCQQAMFPGAGHFFPLTHSRLFVEKTLKFLAGQSAADRRSSIRWSLDNMFLEIHSRDLTSFTASCIDISKHGILIRTNQNMDIGSEISAFASLESQTIDIALRGTIVRESREGVPAGSYFYGVQLHPKEDAIHSWDTLYDKVSRNEKEISI